MTNAAPYKPKSTKFDEAVIASLRQMTVRETLQKLGVHWKADPTFVPIKPVNPETPSIRLNASIGADVFELIATDVKWYDTRARKGGGGAIDLTMHLYREPFQKAVLRLIRETKQYEPRTS